MELSPLILLTCLLAFVVCFSEGRLFCFRRVKRRGKCGGHLRKLNYATAHDCCRGRGMGFATKKQKVGRNRFLCTPCSELQSNKLPSPKKSERRKNRRRNRPATTAIPSTITPASATTSLPTTLSDVILLQTSTRRSVTFWPRPVTQAPSRFSYYAIQPRADDSEENKVEWSEWSPCSASCGAGWRSRFKVCDGCDKNDYENVMSRPCMINFYCPVDGNWGPWFPWQPCSQSCNRGTRVRQRKCNYPPPAYGGSVCAGNATNSQTCNEKACPVDGGWSRWSEYTLCSTTCGAGVKRRVRVCDHPPPAHGGHKCSGSAIVTRKCEVAKCPQDGDWSLWSSWSGCSATCGQGMRTRARSCNSPRPQFGGKDCEGEAVETMQCTNPRPCPIDGAWSEWNDYGFCRAPRCDWGYRIRTRLCSHPRPQHGGAHCKGSNYERVDCFNDQDCPRNGSWCSWSDWSACSATCAEQTSLQVRQRTCTCPEPRFGGSDCEGDSLEVRDCKDLPFCKQEAEEVTVPTTGGAAGCEDAEGSGADEDCDQEEAEDE